VADNLYLEPGRSIESRVDHWYRIVQLLGTGGNAVTYLVIATSKSYKGVPFALKIFRRLSKPERRDSFLREVQFLQAQNHPAVMRVFDEGIFKFRVDGNDNEYPFVVAEYLPQTIRQVMRARNASVAERVSFAVQLLSALSFLEAAEHPVIHRDIKPENIFVKGKSCVLGDFGLMKLVNQADDESRRLFEESIGPGMPFFYRTPDLVAYVKDGVPLTTKTDVFQLGLVLAEMFTGWNPLQRPANNNILAPVVLEHLGQCPGQFGGRIAALLNRMLTIDPAQRQLASGDLPPKFHPAAIRASGCFTS
jgi:serine/threonine protein kinase